MEDYLMNIDTEKCVLCYACVRNCPVKAIAVSSEDAIPIQILNDRCVACGACYEVCPYDAVRYQTYKNICQQLLQADEEVIALVAPSIAGEFFDITDHRKFVQMMRQLGFAKVYEVAIGADYVAKEYKELFDHSKGKYYITSNCPVVVSNIEKFQPDLINNLSPIVSPWIATAKMLRKEYDSNTKMVYIGPCIAAKEEVKRYQDIDVSVVLTFEELRDMFEESGLVEKNLSFSEFDGDRANKGYLYPISNGLIQMMGKTEDLLESQIVTCEGHADFVNSLQNFNTDVNEIKRHLNIFYCNGCINGPGTSKNHSKFIKQSQVVDFAKKRQKSFQKTKWYTAIKKYKELDFSADFEVNDQRISEPSSEEIDKVLKIIGQNLEHSENGCGACGYKNCLEFSVAVSKGLAEPAMCFIYNTRKTQETIFELSKANDKMEKTRQELEESKKKALADNEAMEEAHKISHTMLQELPSAVLVVDKNLKILQSNKGLIEALGDEARDIAEVIPGLIGADLKNFIPFHIQKLFSFVFTTGENIINRDIPFNNEIFTASLFSIKEKEIVGAVFRNMQQPEIQKEQAIERITEVIDKNLEMVQKIGFLLGEGAAETEQMLNSILRSYKQQNGESKISIKPLKD